MELETVKVSKFKSKKFWIKVAALVVAISIIYSMGNSNAKVDLNKEKVDYDQLVSAIKDKQKEVDSVQSKLDDINNQYNAKSAEFEEAKKVVANKNDMDKQILDLSKQIDDKKSQISGLDGQIKSKNDELSSLSGQIVKAKGAPKTLGSGQYVVGKDIPEGRYTAHALASGSNFFVYDGSSGSSKVNTILGKADGLGTGDYTFFCSSGDIIKTEEPVSLTPVQ